MMKKLYYIAIAFAIMINLSCKKDSFQNKPLASLTLINTVTGGTSVRLGSLAAFIPNNNSSRFAIKTNEEELYVWPIGDSVHPYYTYPKFMALGQEIYSLFLGGTSTAVDGILVKDDLPYYLDSLCGIRIINLSPNSPPLNVTLSTSPTVNEVSNLGYKQYTSFMPYPAKSANTTYFFQVRKASDGSLLTSIPLRTPRFANVTLVIRGFVVGSPAIGITLVYHDR